MTPPLSRAMSYVAECLPTSARRAEFLNELRPGYPAETARIDQFMACDQGSVTPQACLRRISFSAAGGGGTTLSVPEISSEATRICRSLARSGEEAMTYSFSSARFAVAVNDTFLDAGYRDTLDLTDRRLMEGILHLYASRLASSLEQVRSRLRTRPDWERRLSRYTVTSPAALNPETCGNIEELERHELAVPGLSFTVPVYRPRSSVYPWELVQSDLLAIFEIAKVFVTPADMDRILHPTGFSDFSIYLSGPYPSALAIEEFRTHRPDLYTEPALSHCGMHAERFGGEYELQHNRFWIRTNPGGAGPVVQGVEDVALPAGVLPVDFSSYGALNHFTWEAFIHEFSHALQDRVLNPRPSPAAPWPHSEAWNNIQRFYRWTRSEFEAHPSQEALIPNSSLNGVSVGNFAVGSLSGRHYALTNATEFFAELATEFIKAEIDQVRPDSAYYRARRRIMLDFFSESGINPQAFDAAAIEAAFRREGIAMTLPPLETPAVASPVPRPASGPTFLWRADFEMARPGRYGPGTYFGIASHPLNDAAPFLSLGLVGLMTVQGAGLGGDLAVEGALGIPNQRLGGSALRFEFYARAGLALDNPAPMVGAGGRLVFTPVATGSAGFHLFAGGGFSTTFRESELPFGFSLGFGINPF